MNSQRQAILDASVRLYDFLDGRHVRNGILRGPDAGIRLNLRIWRFVKSYLGLLYGPEKHVFLQGMGYWVLANWGLVDLLQGERYALSARAASDAVLTLQKEDGSWPYPLRERRHLVATIEGNWGALALLESYRRTGEDRYLRGAMRWKQCLIDRIGFQSYKGTIAVNYFQIPRGNVPNNTTNTLWFFSELAEFDSDPLIDEKIAGMTDFLHEVQDASGELPYIVESPHEKGKQHYLCYQYNAFEFLDLLHFRNNRSHPDVTSILRALARFLDGGMDPSGRARASCLSESPFVTYYAAALSAALLEAVRSGLLPPDGKGQRGLSTLLRNQERDGSFSHSTGDFRFLRDRRSYPRYLAMILYFFCRFAGIQDSASSPAIPS